MAVVDTAEHFALSLTLSGTGAPKLETTEDGRSVVKGLKVFRTGKFKNSRGVQKEWTTAELDAMVSNFNELRSKGSFVDVPVRADHDKSVNRIVGYIEDLKRDGDFLTADFEFTEPEAAKRYERRTYRARSLEVAGFETNDESLHWPVVQGLAFVDIAAVEGLHRQPEVSDEGDTVAESTAHSFTMKGVPTEDYAAVQAYLDELETKVANPPKVEEHTFQVYGADTTDVAAVQAHIDALEGGIHAMAMEAREAFVKNLAEEGKILAPKVDDITTYAKALDTDAYEAWSKQWEFVPGAALFENHGGNGRKPDDPVTGSTLTERETNEQIVETYRRAGRDDEFIKRTDAAKWLAANPK